MLACSFSRRALVEIQIRGLLGVNASTFLTPRSLNGTCLGLCRLVALCWSRERRTAASNTLTSASITQVRLLLNLLGAPSTRIAARLNSPLERKMATLLFSKTKHCLEPALPHSTRSLQHFLALGSSNSNSLIVGHFGPRLNVAVRKRTHGMSSTRHGMSRTQRLRFGNDSALSIVRTCY